ncbi:methyl-accepting chemotaxis protein, partial [Vibrio sp. FNV 38]|nr:methyl-accepting chemotaxis protein [Vibrio sp. FNV 38]
VHDMFKNFSHQPMPLFDDVNCLNKNSQYHSKTSTFNDLVRMDKRALCLILIIGSRMKLSISRKLQLSFAALTAIFLCSGAITYHKLDRVQATTDSLITQDLPVVDTSRQLQLLLEQTISLTRSYMLLGGDERYAANLLTQISSNQQQTAVVLEKLAGMVNQKTIDNTRAQFMLIRDDLQQIIDLSHSAENLPALNLFTEEGAPIAEVVIDMLKNLINDEASAPEGGERKALLKLYADANNALGSALSSMRDFLIYGSADHLEKYHEYLDLHRSLSQEIEAETVKMTGTARRLWSLTIEMQDIYYPLSEQIIQLRQGSDWNRANAIMASDLMPNMATLTQDLDKIVLGQSDAANQKGHQVQANVQEIIVFMLMSVVGIVIAATLISMLLGKSIARRLAIIAQRAENIAQGNISEPPLMDKGNDELATLTQYINQMSQSLNAVVSSVTGSVNRADTGMEDLLAKNANTMKQTGIQNDAINQVAQQADEIKQAAESTTQLAEESLQALNESSHTLAQGSLSLEENQRSIQSLYQKITGISQQVEVLQQQTDGIEKVTDVIEGLAEQTNLLALNAAIEAARAGEQGRGFAVVAEEVRNLATRTTDSTVEIDKLLTGIKQSTHSVVAEMGQSVQLAQESNQVTESVVITLSEGTHKIDQLNQQMASLAAAADQQFQSVRSIDELMQHVDQSVEAVSQENHKQSQITQQVRTQMGDLTQELGHFKLS